MRTLAAAVLISFVAAGLGAQEADTRPDSLVRTMVSADFSYQSFGGTIDPWRMGSVSLAHRTSAGSLIARVNVANRFATNGSQVEVDAYPSIRKGTYAYLNAGYSASSIFPGWRAGAEIFQSLPAAWEASLGVRQLRFSGVPVTLYTGSVGLYSGDYWISLRPYVRSGSSASAGLTVRRYGEDNEHFVGAFASFGSSPTDHLTPDELARTNSFNGGIQGSTSLAKRILGTWALSASQEGLDNGASRHSWTASGGIAFIF